MDRLKNEVAIITAAGSGMGRGGAILFAKEGAKVVVSDYNLEGAEETVRLIKEAGGEAVAFKCNVGNLDELKALVDFTVETYGGIDIVWNHVGVPGPEGLFATPEQWDMMCDINLKSCYFLAQYAVPHLRESKSNPAMLFTGSTSAVCGSPNAPIYSAVKGGVVNLTRALAAYLGKENIRVNCILPGPTASPMWKEFSARPGKDSPEQVAAYNAATIAGNPMRRMQQPEELASPALALVEPASSYVNGAILPSDGGFTAV